MKLKRIVILLIAAAAGSIYYKISHSIGGKDGIYASLTGPGSLSQTFRAARSGEEEEASSSYDSPIGTVGNPYLHSIRGTALSHHHLSSDTPAEEEKTLNDLPLLQAAARGDVAAVSQRLAVHAWVDSRDSERRTALMHASQNGYHAIIERLVAAGANLALEDRSGNNALDYAAGRGRTDTVQFLLNHAHASDDNDYAEYAAIIRAAYAGDPEALPKGRLASINRVNPDGVSPLHIAAGTGAVAMMAELIKRGAQVDTANNEGRTPLHWAAWDNQPQAIELLVSHGCDLSARDSAGDTPLLLAVENNSKDAVKMLVDKGADKYLADKQGKTAGIIAEDKGYKDLAGMLQ